jgi:cholesterol transport system auxiliary component
MIMKIICRIILFALFISGGLVPAGCMSLEKKYPNRRQYLMDVERSDSRKLPDNDLHLKVRRFSASPVCARKEFVYRVDAVRYETDYYNEFFIAPGDMLSMLAADWLQQAGLFQSVFHAYSRVESTHVLEGRVEGLYGDFTDAAHPCAVFVLNIYLIREEPDGSSRLLHNQEYTRKIPVAGNTPEALVDGWNTAFRDVMNELETDMQTVMNKQE